MSSGVPGGPEPAAWIASIHRPRIVLMESVSRSVIICPTPPMPEPGGPRWRCRSSLEIAWLARLPSESSAMAGRIQHPNYIGTASGYHESRDHRTAYYVLWAEN